MHYTNSSKYKLLLVFSLGRKVLRGFIKSFFHFKGSRIVAVGFLGRRNDLTVGKRVKIEDGASIQSVSENGIHFGANITILDGVTIKSGCIIGAGAVVTKSTEPNGVYAGVPARKIKERS